jgi:four helix bundle protein
MATGSCYELETQLTISKNLDYIAKNEFETLKSDLTEIQKMMYALIKSLS